MISSSMSLFGISSKGASSLQEFSLKLVCWLCRQGWNQLLISEQAQTACEGLLMKQSTPHNKMQIN